MTIWFDLEDLVRYFHYAPRPTGIQRLSFEMAREIARLGGGGVAFCRRGRGASGLRGLDFASLEASVLAAAAADDPRARRTALGRAGRQPTRLETMLRTLPPLYLQPLGEASRGAAQAFKGLRGVASAGAAQLKDQAMRSGRIGGAKPDATGADVVFAPGDWFVCLGASWHLAYGPEFLAGLKTGGVRFALLVYDLIPELFPEWTIPASAGGYQRWLREVIPAADAVFAISHATARDTESCLAAAGIAIAPPVVLPVGSAPPAAPAATPSPLADPYVLLVSTLEIRKNHLLMFRVWRRLLQNLPPAQVPDLVFAGKTGWMVADLLQQLENCAWLNGKIKYLPSPSEPQLAALYRHCLFTVFPSFYEGWGLPITESLGFGKTVAAANNSAIPEAGGTFCSYYNPNNLDDAYNTIETLILHPDQIAAAETHIAANFNPPSWSDSAVALLEVLQADR